VVDYRVNTEIMAQAAVRVEDAATVIDRCIAKLRTEMTTLFGSWSGDSAHAHGEAHQRFDADAKALHLSLMQIHRALLSTHRSYTVQESEQSTDGRGLANQVTNA
jgi:WXG100 family type VII secretion target